MRKTKQGSPIVFYEGKPHSGPLIWGRNYEVYVRLYYTVPVSFSHEWEEQSPKWISNSSGWYHNDTDVYDHPYLELGFPIHTKKAKAGRNSANLRILSTENNSGGLTEDFVVVYTFHVHRKPNYLKWFGLLILVSAIILFAIGELMAVINVVFSALMAVLGALIGLVIIYLFTKLIG